MLLVNSGSEANDLAWRIAAGVTGNGSALVTEHAYHGVTAGATCSRRRTGRRARPRHRARRSRLPAAAPDLVPALDAALAQLDRGLAATFLDGSLMSDGIYTPAAHELRLLLERTHAAGGLYVADEVQAGHGRLGAGPLVFARHGIAPDVVTLGKPMGNGYPVAAVVTRRELAEQFPYAGRTFSTFGGNPVAASAALAVLDVLEDERLPDARLECRRATARGRSRVSASGKSWRCAAAGSSRASSFRAASWPARVADELRDQAVLVGLTGSGTKTCSRSGHRSSSPTSTPTARRR